MSSPDGTTRTSRVVGSVDFVRPTNNDLLDENDADEQLLTILTGIRCAMPFTIKALKQTWTTELQMLQAANQVFDLIELKMSNYNPNSEVCCINNTDFVGEYRDISKPLAEVLVTAKEMVKLTRGAFDPAVAPLLQHYQQLADTISTSSSSAGTKEEEEETGEVTADDAVAAATAAAVDLDLDTIRRQRAVVNHMRGLVYRGFATSSEDDNENNHSISNTVLRLMQISTWSNAFSVVGCYNDNQNGNDRTSQRPVVWKSITSTQSMLWQEKDDGTTGSTTFKICKKHKDARLDVNGIAKGWAVDALAETFGTPCYVEWGGDVKVRGRHPSGGGRLWTVAVPEPPSLAEIRAMVESAKKSGDQTGPVYKLASEYAKQHNNKQEQQKYLAILQLRDGDAVATSGDYENVMEHNGKLYPHIINPQHGRLLELNNSSTAQAVVVAKSCMVADALATAAMAIGSNPAQARAMLDPFRTGYRIPLSDYLLYARHGPRIIRLQIPGVEEERFKQARLQRHHPAKVIVVGSGLAGMCAAIEAADARAHVIILEKESQTGGNSAKATSGMNGWGTDTQAEQGVADDERLFERDTFRSGLGGTSNPSLVRTLSTKSAPAVHWLKEKFGIPLTALSQCGGHSRKRTHRAPPNPDDEEPIPIGFLIMQTLKTAIETVYADKIEIRCGQTVTRILHVVKEDGGGNNKTVTGVQVNGNEELMADAVILATGGFGCSKSPHGLMARFRPDLLGVPTTNGSFAQGDGVSLSEELGAELIDMDKVQLHPTGFIDPANPSNPTKYLAPEAIRGCGGILVNDKGKRFVNELDLRSVVATGILEHCAPYKSDEYTGPPFAWCILSQPAQAMFGIPALNYYKDKLGLLEYCENAAAAAALIGCSEEALCETLNDYNEAAMVGSCLLTQKSIFPTRLAADSIGLILARVTPSIHYTMGGININAAGEVQEKIKETTVGSHRRIHRLFAAGEVTGGVHGGNRLAGNSLLECVVYGRIAGQRAATVNMPDAVMFPEAASDDNHSESNWQPVVVREVRNTDTVYGINTREVRFNLHGPLQCSGLEVGQFVGVRGELDGETLMGYFSPITRPDDRGVIGILCRLDSKGGPISMLLDKARPGSVLQMSAMGGLRLKFEGGRIIFRGQEIRRIGLLAGGTGIAPMIQIIRAYGRHVRENQGSVAPGGLNLIYAAEDVGDLAYMKILEELRSKYPEHFRFYVILNRPPLGWTEGIGFAERQDIQKHMMYPPAKGHLVVMCGPPVFEGAMRKTLVGLGFSKSQWFSFSEDDRVSSHL